jgi:hypothetical protein
MKVLMFLTLLELIWTVSPAFILIAIAFPSFRLLYLLDEVISPTITIKVVGHQWYWSYEYSDYITESGDAIEFDSYMIPSECFGKTFERGKLSNSGEALKLTVPSHSRKVMSGWSNDPDMVTSPKMIENEMGYRGSKSILLNSIVKEQRVDGSYCIKSAAPTMQLRCTLMGFERNYQLKIPSKQFTQRSYSTLNSSKEAVKGNNNNTSLLHPWFITGFSDAEGSFNINISPDSRSKLKWSIQITFIINLPIKDRDILEQINNTLETGTLYSSQNLPIITNRVKGIKDLQKIINHFDKYPLVSSKISNYLLFKQAFEIVKSGEHLTLTGLMKILSLKSALNHGLSDKLLKAFPNVLILKAQEYKFQVIPHPMWVAGFTSGDNSFFFK